MNYPSAIWLSLRNLLWIILLPGVVAGYVPWRFFGLREVQVSSVDQIQILALVVIGVGTVLLSACIWQFAESGRGTLSPIDPPTSLVVRGLYRYVRNPMYLSVTLIVLGEALVTRSTDLVLYWVVWFSLVNLFVLGYEEPALRRSFGPEYEEYRRRVPRWLPSRPSDRPTKKGT